LAEIFGEKTALALTVRQAMNRSRPIRSNRSSAPAVRSTDVVGRGGRVLDGQIATMSSASEQADCALKELVALYDDGNLRSMIDGVVGKVLVSPGSVVRPGEPMIEIVGKHRFVVAWFPVSRLYRLQVGDAVTVSTGVAVSTGGATCPARSPRSASLPTRCRKNSRRHSRP